MSVAYLQQQKQPHSSLVRSAAQPGRSALSPARVADQQPAGHSLAGNQTGQHFAQSCPLARPSPASCPFGGVCHSCPVRVQAKLKIGEPNDKYEQEADRVADQIMRMRDWDTYEKKAFSGQPQGTFVQRTCTNCEDELRRKPFDQKEEILLEKENAGRNLQVGIGMDLPRRINNLNGKGQPLPKYVRTIFEPRFGYDFSKVRIHTGDGAAELARGLHARALTVGRNIVFNRGEQNWGSYDGRTLLAHELTHVVQQNAAGAHTIPSREGLSLSFSRYQYPMLRRHPDYQDIEIDERGDDTFFHEVIADCSEIEQSPTGSRLLAEINRRSGRWGRTIIKRASDRGCATDARGWGNFGQIWIYHEPQGDGCEIRPSGDWHDSSYNSVYLAHELIHTLHYYDGSHSSDPASEERRTVGLGRFSYESFSENRIRCEKHWPVRTFYFTDDQQWYQNEGYGQPTCTASGEYRHRPPLQAGSESERRLWELVEQMPSDDWIHRSTIAQQTNISPPQVAQEAGGTHVTRSFESEIRLGKGQGRSLPNSERVSMERAFGVEFGNVRIHFDETADRLNRLVNALAFTLGTDIFFRRGAYNLDSRQGQKLLAHELTHIVQQRGYPPGSMLQCALPNISLPAVPTVSAMDSQIQAGVMPHIRTFLGNRPESERDRAAGEAVRIVVQWLQAQNIVQYSGPGVTDITVDSPEYRRQPSQDAWDVASREGANLSGESAYTFPVNRNPPLMYKVELYPRALMGNSEEESLGYLVGVIIHEYIHILQNRHQDTSGATYAPAQREFQAWLWQAQHITELGIPPRSQGSSQIDRNLRHYFNQLPEADRESLSSDFQAALSALNQPRSP